VHGILKTHGGYLRFESKPGKGANFHIYLPLSQQEAPGVLHPGASVGPRAQGTILFVDDETVVRNFARAALQKCGYEVILAEDGGAAVELVQRFRDPIHLVILDFAMPVMNDVEAFEQIRRISRAVPVILSSGFSEAETTEKFRNGPNRLFFAKTYTAPRLAQAVKEALVPRDPQQRR
jgi:two-component system cell cycle sensor histidine kinase/response regulator CckA